MISGIDSVTVATDDERIMECVEAAGGFAIMTSRKHPSGTDRIAEAARKMGIGKEDIVVNVQGDQPLLDPEHVLAIIKMLQKRPELAMTTPACPLDITDRKNSNRVKVVVDRKWKALYFSRSLIPYDRDGIWEGSKSREKTPGKAPQSFYLRHLGLYAYRNEFLQTFVKLKPGPLEEVEKLEQLRALENGYSIGVALVEKAPLDVDAAQDLEQVRSILL
jgi:3-deoxy-manno-octulosonate cytidylyltransferase (CMP-KDO synthetase)